MKILSLSALLFLGSSLLPQVYAATYTETGDAGDLPATAQIVSGASGTSLTQISGRLTLTNNTSDGDMFKISITNTSTFAVSMLSGRGFNNFDSQLMLFSSTGAGVKANDDAASGSPQAAIPTGALTGLPTGTYYLLISGSGRYATDSAGNLIFPNYNDGTTDPTLTYSPYSSTAIVANYTGFSSEAGAYMLSLTGAEFVPVPESRYAGLLAAGTVGLAALRRFRRRATVCAAGRSEV